MTWKGLLYSGDQIHITATIANMKLHGIHDTMDLEIQLVRDNEPIVEMLYQLLVRGMKKAGERKEKKHIQALEMGQKLGEQSMSVTMDQGVRYAKASGDHNPIHIDEEVAKRAGFPRTIVHGLCTMAFSSKAIVDELLDGNPTRIKSMSARFSKPVLMGQTLTTELYDGGSKGGHSIIHYITKNPEGIPVITRGIAEFSE
jgi:acyl dehydratase